VWHTIEIAEQSAEGVLADPTDLALAQETAERLFGWEHWLGYALLSTARASAWEAADQTMLGVDMCIADELPPAAESTQPRLAERLDEPSYEAGLLRCSFGPLPFRSILFQPSWRTTTIMRLAEGIYEARDFGGLPILADALEDVGCTNADILNHCRQPSEHVRGCWVLDLVSNRA
jgi:hypothetical protein